MIEKEFATVEGSPKDIFQTDAGVSAIGNDFHEGGTFGIGWLAAEAPKIDFFDDLFGGKTLIGPLFEELSFHDFALDGGTIQEMKGLGKGRIGAGLASADGGASGAAESGEEIGARTTIGDLDGAGTERQTAEFVFGLGRGRDAIEQVFGWDATDGGVGVVSQIVLVIGGR